MNYLLEIGIEELPARYVELALNQIREKADKFLKENLIDYKDIRTYATPRRLTLFIDGIEEFQRDINEEVKGPAKKIAFDEDGNPTKPLEGFLKSKNLKIEDIEIKDLKGTEYVYGEVHKKGEKSEEILKVEIPNLIKTMTFPKNMKWGGKNLKFARPIRWIVSMIDSTVVEFPFEGIPVGNVTRGHRFLGSSHIEIDHVDNYEKLLEENYVILDQKKRLEIIKINAKKEAKALGGEIKEDKDLLDELTYINEYPTPITGNVKEEYLELPAEVITTPMRDHLRYIPVYDEDGKLLPYFITVRNGTDYKKEIVSKGNEKVLGARLEDAKFFYNEDIKTNLEDLNENLKGLMFQDKLGTMYDKSLRIDKLSREIGEKLEVADESLIDLKRAAELSKADLTTKMVTEFTELQGTIGSIYSKLQGEKALVSQAIFEQYLPRFAGDMLPETTIGSILAIADKIDTIVGLFAIGLIPTGSQDPFALRRLSIGVINIIKDKNWDLSLSDIVDHALYTYVQENNLTFNYEEVKEQILDYFRARIKNILEDMDIRYDIIKGVIESDGTILETIDKATKLNEFFKEDRTELVDALTRVHNLATKYEEGEVVEENLEDESEKELYNKFESLRPEVEALINEKKYGEALSSLNPLVPFIDRFFDSCMVLVDDEKVRSNRLALLHLIDSLVERVVNIESIKE